MADIGIGRRVREWWLEVSGVGEVLGSLDSIGDELERQTRESRKLHRDMIVEMRSRNGAMCRNLRQILREEGTMVTEAVGALRQDVQEMAAQTNAILEAIREKGQ